MENKNILLIIFANTLWSLIPVIVYGLFDEISIVTIIFLRFFSAAIILFLLTLLLVFLNNKNPSNVHIGLREAFKFLRAKNKKFFNLKNIYCSSILGFVGIILQVVFYFLALKFTTVSITMIGTLFSIVIIAFYEHGTKSEKLDVFKTLYLIMVIFSIVIIILVKTSQTGYEFTTNGIIYLIIYIVFLTFFQISIDREHLTKDEITLINKNHNYKIIRLFLRLSITFFMGIVIMFPTFLILNFLPVRTDLTLEINQFFTDLGNTPTNLFRWEIMFLIIFSTITPYLLIFIAYSRWNPYDLTYAQWISILTVIDPIGSIFFGVLFGIETFPLLYLSTILFLLGASIFLRYAHESKNLVNAYIILEYKSGMMENLELKLLKLEGVYCVESLLGTYDVLLKVKTNSIKNIYYLKNTGIKSIEGIKPDSIKILFVDKILKITE